MCRLAVGTVHGDDGTASHLRPFVEGHQHAVVRQQDVDRRYRMGECVYQSLLVAVGRGIVAIDHRA